MRLSVAVLAFALASASLLIGCRSAEVRFVNDSAATRRVSPADSISQLLAQNMLKLLAGRREDYRVGPEDLIEVTVYEWETPGQSKTTAFRVSEGGVISLPVFGEVNVAEKSVAQIKMAVEDRLREGDFIRQPQVSVDIKEFASKRVGVIGAVNQPGFHILKRNYATLLEAIAQAGGLNERAGYVAYVMRPLTEPLAADTDAATASAASPSAAQTAAAGLGGEVRTLIIDLHDLLEQGNLALNVVLEPGSVVNIPEAGMFSVIGFVNRPGSFPLHRPTTVLEAIALGGGLREREASPRYTFLKRQTVQGEQIISLDLVAVSRGEAPNLGLMPGDVVDVRQKTHKRILLGAWDAFKAVFNIGYNL